MLSIDEAIALVKIERECVIRADVCDRKCEKCDLVQDSTELTDMYEQLAEWLEELKAIKEKGRYVQGNKAGQKIGYNKAIDDFVANVKDVLITDYSVFNTEDIRIFIDIIEEIAEQLKAGGNNGIDNQ